jgi:hypothetical protein
LASDWIDGLVDDRAAMDVAADTAAITSAAVTMAVPLSTILVPVTIAGWDDEDEESSSDDDPDDKWSLLLLALSLEESSTSNDAFLSWRGSSPVATLLVVTINKPTLSFLTLTSGDDGANAVPTSLGATTRGRGLAAFKTFANWIICSRFFSAGRDFGMEGSSAMELVVEAGVDNVATLSPFLFFFENFDCVGRDFGATAGCAEVSTVALALTLPVTTEWEWVWQLTCSGGLEVKNSGSPHGILPIA